MPRPNAGPRLKPGASGYWYIHWTERKRSRRLSTGTKDRREAETVLAGFLVERGRASHGEVTVAQAWELYWREHVREKVADPTRLEICWGHLAPVFGDQPAEEIEAGDVMAYIRERDVSSATVRRELGTLSACLNHAAKTRRIGRAPYIPLPPAGEPRDRWLTLDEIRRLEEAAAPNDRARLFVAIALATGARRRSIELLRWQQIDFDRGLIDFNNGRRQSKKRRPVVPMSDKLAAILADAWLQQPASDYVLGSDGSIRKAFTAAVRRAGLSGVTPHTLRHTYATHAAMNGVPLVDIARVLGNSLAMVEKVYSKWAPEYLLDAVNRAYDPTARARSNVG